MTLIKLKIDLIIVSNNRIFDIINIVANIDNDTYTPHYNVEGTMRKVIEKPSDRVSETLLVK